MDLKTTLIPRYIRFRLGQYLRPFFTNTFMDETSKQTKARWKADHVWRRPGTLEVHVLYKLDARSVRYMKRVKIVECCELEGG